MNVRAPQPSARRVFSVIWFPFFFVVVMCWLFSLTFSAPQPHGVKIAVVAGQGLEAPSAVASASELGRYRWVTVENSDTAGVELRKGAVAAAVLCPAGEAPSCKVLSASASGRGRALTLNADLRTGLESTGHQVTAVDVAPLAPGDRSGSGLFFFALPLAMTGMVTSIMLLQLAMWPTSRKVAVIAAVGVFASVVDYLLAVGRQVLPPNLMLVLWAFVLVEAIALITTAAATWLRQFFVPVVLTFVLLLGVPTSGGTVTADMLPVPLALLHRVLPLGALVDLTRATAYGIGSAAGPAAVLACWAVAGVGLMALAHRHRSRQALVNPPVAAPTAQSEHTLLGVVTSLSGVPINRATVTVLDDSGREVERGTTVTDGSYKVGGISTGLHHLVVTAEHCEPVVVTLSLAAAQAATRRDIRLEDWRDPAGNLSAQEIG